MKLLSVEYPQPNICLFTFSATGQELEDAAAIVYERMRASFKIKGFERGVANRAEIEAERGEHVFWYDAINDVMDAQATTLYQDAVDDLDIDFKIVNKPAFDLVSINKEDGFVATAEVCLLPDFEIAPYTGISATGAPSYVTEEMIKHYVDRKRRLSAELVPHKGPAVKGNTVHITYLGLIDGKPFEGGQAENQELVLGRGGMIPGFEDGIIGHCAGDAFDINVTFPEKYKKAELAGKEAIFKTKLIDTCVKEIPALNADFAKKVGGVDTLEEYYVETRKRLELMRYNNAMNNAKTQVITKFHDLIVGEVPEPLISQAYTREMVQVNHSLQERNMSKADYLQELKMSDESFTEQLRTKAERSVRVNLGLLQVGIAENLLPSDEEIDKLIQDTAAKQKRSVEELLATNSRISFIQAHARKAAAAFLVEHANIEITAPVPPEGK